MATFVPADAIKILMRGTDQTRAISMALWAVKSPAAVPTASELSALATAIGTNIPANGFLAFMSPSFTWTEVECRDASVERGPSATEPMVAPGTAADGNPSAIAAKGIIEPALGVFQFRPSQTFIPGVPVSALTEPGSDTLTSAYLTAADDFLASIDGLITTVAGYALGCVSKNIHGLPRTPTALVSQASGHSVRPTVATQVRRLRRVPRRGA